MEPTSPTSQPSAQPSRQPSRQPTSQPTRQPSSQPSRQPSRQPTGQRLGANTFVIHDKGNLSGEYHKGQSVQVKYANQRATAVELTRTQGRDQGQGPSLGVNR